MSKNVTVKLSDKKNKNELLDAEQAPIMVEVEPVLTSLNCDSSI